MNHKGNKQGVWLALAVKTREIVGVYSGDRSEAGAKALWQSLSPIDRQGAVCYTDFGSAYAAVLPSQRHHAVGQESGLTHRIERFNGTLRQRVRAWCEKPCHFRRSWTITLAQSDTLAITTTHPYLVRTTNQSLVLWGAAKEHSLLKTV